MLSTIFHKFLYQPLFNALVLLYQFLPGKSFGLAVIVLTILIRILLYPLMFKSIKSQRAMSELQPKIKEIQDKYKDDKEKQNKELMELYQKEKINPFGGCFPLLIQLPMLVALYRVFWHGMEAETMNYLYSFVSNPGSIDPIFLGFINLAEPNIILALVAGVAQFFQAKMLTPKQEGKADSKAKDTTDKVAGIMQKQMLYFLPILTISILWRLPAAIGLYWIITAIFSIIQQKIVLKPNGTKQPKTN